MGIKNGYGRRGVCPFKTRCPKGPMNDKGLISILTIRKSRNEDKKGVELG